jgi:amino-acid N-acetyltransferase
MVIAIRPATEADSAGIRALVRSERVNPTGLDWRNFVVAADERGLVGAAQMRRHSDGSRELGSLVVGRQARGRGIAARLIDALLADERGRVLMITGEDFAAHYRRWGFRRIEPGAAPAAIRWNHRIGRMGGVVSLIKRRPIRRLVILDRAGPAVADDRPQPDPGRTRLPARGERRTA